MFDWNEEELANIIWGEPGESDDHIVPYPETSQDYCENKEGNHDAASIRTTEQKTPGTKVDSHGRRFDSSSTPDLEEGISASGFDIESWADVSSSKAAKTGDVNDKLNAISKLDSSRRDTGKLETDADIYPSADEGEEKDGFAADYGWDNIGSFDDLDRLFSNDDPLFGHVNLGNADELWSSSKDITNIPVKSSPISGKSSTSGVGGNAPKHVEIKTEILQQDEQLLTLSYGEINDPVSQGVQSANEILENMESAGGKSAPIAQTDLNKIGKATAAISRPASEYVVTSSEACRQKKLKLVKFQKKIEETGVKKMLKDRSSSAIPSAQFENHLTPAMVKYSPSSILAQDRQLQGLLLQYQHISNPFLHHPAYGTPVNPHPSMPLLSHIQTGELQQRQLLSGYDMSPGCAYRTNKTVDDDVKTLTMTPQEKIEKLRRRQQMQAMLAIQKQHQQFSHQVPCITTLSSQKCPLECQIQNFEKADLSAEDPNSPLEQNDSSSVSFAIDKLSWEDRVLHRLQDIVSKLDMKVRLCIRDSLFRLAQSAMQRHYASDTGSTNKTSRDEHEVAAKGEMNSDTRYAGMPDAETETNPIDRTVAHLLFHMPSELSANHPDGPQSPIFAKLSCEHKAARLPESSNNIMFSQQGPKNSRPSNEPQRINESKSSPCAETSENESNNEPADGGALEVEASR